MRGLAHAAGATVLRVGESRPSAAGSAATERAVETVMVHTYCMVVAPLEAMHTPGGVFGAGWGWPPYAAVALLAPVRPVGHVNGEVSLGQAIGS